MGDLKASICDTDYMSAHLNKGKPFAKKLALDGLDFSRRTTGLLVDRYDSEIIEVGHGVFYLRSPQKLCSHNGCRDALVGS